MDFISSREFALGNIALSFEHKVGTISSKGRASGGWILARDQAEFDYSFIKKKGCKALSPGVVCDPGKCKTIFIG